MFADLIEKIKNNPEWGDIAKERAQKILENSEVFSCHEGVKGIVKGPGWPLIPVTDLYGFLSYLVNALSFINVESVKGITNTELIAEYCAIFNRMNKFFKRLEQRNDIPGLMPGTQPKIISKAFNSFWRTRKLIKHATKPDYKEATKQLIRSFLKYSPDAPNTLIADKVLIILQDIGELREDQLPSHSSLRQQVGDLRRNAESHVKS